MFFEYLFYLCFGYVSEEELMLMVWNEVNLGWWFVEGIVYWYVFGDGFVVVSFGYDLGVIVC